jgi:hypothetical protein
VSEFWLLLAPDWSNILSGSVELANYFAPAGVVDSPARVKKDPKMPHERTEPWTNANNNVG